MATTLNLRFAIIGEPETTQPYMKGIDGTMDTEELKTAIYQYKQSFFENVKDSSSLVLYRVSLTSSEYTSEREFSGDDTKPQKVMTGSISGYFKDGAEEDKIHIIVKRPKGIATVSFHIASYDTEEHEESSSVKRRADDDDDDGGSRKRVKTLESELKGRELNIPTIEYRHTFYDRENFTREVIPFITTNYFRRGIIDHKSHTFFLIPGGSGIGKSRAGYETQHLITHADQLGITLDPAFREALQDTCYLYVNLNNGCKYTYAIDEKYKHLTTVRIGARLAVAAGLGPENLEEMVSCPLELYTVESVLHEILNRRFSTTGRTLKTIIIHIDEYQEYISNAQSGGRRSRDDALKFFKELLSPIGRIMTTATNKQFFIIPICTGTSAIDVHFLHSDYRKCVIQLSPLNYNSAIQMFRDNYPDVNQELRTHIEDQHHFRIALNDTGFIPSYIDILLEPKNLSRTHDWGNKLYWNVFSKYSSIYGMSYAGSEVDIRLIISFGLTGMVIKRDQRLPSGKTVGEVERAGLIYLTQVDPYLDGVTLVMPFVQLKILNTKLESPVIPDDKLLIPTKDRPWKWHDFEVLLPYYHKAIIDALISTDKGVIDLMAEINECGQNRTNAVGSGNEDLRNSLDRMISNLKESLAEKKAMIMRPLSKIFRGAKGSKDLLKREVKLREMDVFQEAVKCLVFKTDMLPFVNDILCDDGTRHERQDGIFSCMKGTANIDSRWIMTPTQGEKKLGIYVQVKHSELTTRYKKFNHGDLKDWYDRIENSTSTFQGSEDSIIVIITNRLYTVPPDDQYGPDGISDMPNLLLIDEPCIKKYLSPTFAYRGLLAVPA
ncbi:hypothetical protein BGZ76_005294 [Entomortierella beljakovae]|nr:hypothetical protein BGZ76_005294 [Entomortierella beljakovae]